MALLSVGRPLVDGKSEAGFNPATTEMTRFFALTNGEYCVIDFLVEIDNQKCTIQSPATARENRCSHG